jgi:quercetin dioxygenase-like cupin family protein
MKYNLIFGIVLGAAIGFLLGKTFNSAKATSSESAPNNATAAKADTAKWTWPDSLDAVIAAPQSHGIIYEDEKVRILHVTVAPGQTEPIHAHKWRSIAWATQSPSFTLYHYALGQDNHLVRTDSFNAQLALNTANKWAPETPHAIRNRGQDSLVLYRVEFKQ